MGHFHPSSRLRFDELVSSIISHCIGCFDPVWKEVTSTYCKSHLIALAQRGKKRLVKVLWIQFYRSVLWIRSFSNWATSQSPLLKPEDLLLFKHLRAMLFDLLTSARLGAGDRAVDQLIDSLPNRISASPEN